jgi:hypothetical protein
LTVEIRSFGILRGGILTSSFDFSGDEEEDEEDFNIIEAIWEHGRGAIGIATSTVLL